MGRVRPIYRACLVFTRGINYLHGGVSNPYVGVYYLYSRHVRPNTMGACLTH